MFVKVEQKCSRSANQEKGGNDQKGKVPFRENTGRPDHLKGEKKKYDGTKEECTSYHFELKKHHQREPKRQYILIRKSGWEGEGPDWNPS